MPLVAVKMPLLQTTFPPTSTIGLLAPPTGTAMVPVVPEGAVTSSELAVAGFPAQATCTAPCGVGAWPSAQARSPGCGCTSQVAYPAVTGWMPSMYPDSAEVGVLAQPCERLEDEPKPGAPLLSMFSHMVPVSSGPGGDHVAPFGVQQRLGVGGVAGGQPGVQLVPADVGAVVGE